MEMEKIASHVLSFVITAIIVVTVIFYTFSTTSCAPSSSESSYGVWMNAGKSMFIDVVTVNGYDYIVAATYDGIAICPAVHNNKRNR